MTNGNDNVNCKLHERTDPGKLVQRFEVVVLHVLLVGCDWEGGTEIRSASSAMVRAEFRMLSS